ncbi:regulator of nonsense transcripts 3A-like isoform X2 [Xenia sp. Carnegie-2017]|uniref:regulator of nonsense transcripts 3A-like isoform X2 n=1 Tax=Xenia sp. Carnegie-2017 TaxID=2897299 RepID=UPI001F0458E0|nr:regulator of nonsense transcripts 3A-like isoform X2 [Xenia sp. Carnegie-2017]
MGQNCKAFCFKPDTEKMVEPSVDSSIYRKTSNIKIARRVSFSPVPFSRAYINFKNVKDILAFKERLDGYLFTDNKGGKYPVVVEFSPFQGVPKKGRKKKDIKCGTIDKDPEYLAFLEMLEKEVEPLPSAEIYLEQMEANKQNMKDAKVSTPLIEFMKMKKSSGKSRISSQRSSSTSSSEKKKKAKESRGGNKNSETQKSGDAAKKERGAESNDKKTISSNQSGEHKNKLPSESKDKGHNVVKEKPFKNRPSSGRTFKDSKSQSDGQRSNFNSSRNSNRHPRRDKGVKDCDSNRADSRSSSTSSHVKGEETKKGQLDARERVRNKDRPAQAIYQPRSRPRGSSDEPTGRNSGRSTNKEQGKPHRDVPSRDEESSQRNTTKRDREFRDDNYRQPRDA